MKELNIEIAVKIYDYEELDAADRELMDAAREATNRSYAPYSHFSVGAAARLANGIVVTGTNQENAAYPSGLCAERTTLFYANSQHPDQAVTTLAIAARNEHDEFLESPIPPCGACRELMMQLGPGSTHIEILMDYPERKTVTLGALVPDWWGGERFAAL